MYVVSAESCLCLTCSSDNIITALPVEELHLVQEEADSHIILHYLFASAALDSRGTVVVRSPDTDVFVLLVHYCSRIGGYLFFDTGTFNAGFEHLNHIDTLNDHENDMSIIIFEKNTMQKVILCKA